MEKTASIYLPVYNPGYCATFINSDTIRVYDTLNLNEINKYTDYFINSHYLSNPGEILLTEDVNCLDPNLITTDFYYRNDLDSILICFLIILIICFYLPFRVMCRFWKKLK